MTRERGREMAITIITGILIPFFLGFFFAIYEHFHRLRDSETLILVDKYFTTKFDGKLKLYRSTYKVALKMWENTPIELRSKSKPLVTPGCFISEDDRETMKASNVFINSWPDYIISSAFWPITKLVILMRLKSYNKKIKAVQATMYNNAKESMNATYR